MDVKEEQENSTMNHTDDTATQESSQAKKSEDVSSPGPAECEPKKRNINATEIPPGMSKNQMKKMLRNQRWLETKATRRAQEKQKRKEKRKILKDSGEPLPPNRKVLKRNSMKNSSCHTSIVIDCSFDDLMVEKDINKLVKQLNYCYAANRRMADPVQFHITSWGNKTKARMVEIGDYKGWDVNFKSEDYVDVFNKDSIVYLTSDSPNILSSLDDDKAYIIGGLVDHNHQKGLCYKLAQEKGLAHAQLPIGDYLAMKTRKVLTINHVFEILLEFTHSKSWESAFFKVIPGRKVEHFKSSGKSSDADKNTDASDDEEKETKCSTDTSESNAHGSSKDSLTSSLPIISSNATEQNDSETHKNAQLSKSATSSQQEPV